MKIAYIVTWDMGSDDGVIRKIESQTSTWLKLGHECRVFAISQRPCVREELAGRSEVILRDAGGLVPGKVQLGKFFKTVAANWRLAACLRAWQPDVAYLRFQSYIPGIGSVLSVCPTFIEINSDDVAEARIYSRMWGFKSKLRQWYNSFTRRFIFHRATGLVSMTHELLANPVFAKFRKPGFVTPNSVPQNRIVACNRSVDTDPRPMVILTASGGHSTEESHWHGVDKVLRLAEKTQDQLRFMIVGADLVVTRQPPANVKVVGMVNPSDLAALYAQSDVAFGTLALHRKGMNEACAFKVRDALQYGLPVISGCLDTAIVGQSYQWWMNLPNHENNLDEALVDIVKFCYSWRGRRIPAETVVPLISMESWESQKLHFIQELINYEK